MDKAKGKNHHKVCWICGKPAMQPDDRGNVCTECGATFTDIAGGGRLKKDDVGIKLYEEANPPKYSY